LQCCQMTVINLCLNGLYGVVSHMDSLRMLEWRRWEVKLHPVYLTPYIREIDLSKIESIDVKIQTIEIPEIKPVQTTLDLMFESVDMLL